MKNFSEFYDPIKNGHLEKGHCFLCGKKINKTNRTEEHIFPLWLLKRYNLLTQTITLPNGKHRQYKKIKIPCCRNCNSTYLGKLEDRIKRTADSGYSQFDKIPKVYIFQWLLKIYYQLLYMDMNLLLDPKNNSDKSIIDKEFLERYKMCHFFLQSIRIKSNFHKPFPWSIFIFKLQKHKDCKLNFDYKDDMDRLTIAIRMDDIGIIACLQDNNTQEIMFNKNFELYKTIALHPIQFDELIAKIFYKNSLIERLPKYIIMSGKNGFEFVSLPLQGASTTPIYRDWSQREYAMFFSFFMKIPFEKCYIPPNKVLSFLYDEKNKLRKININKKIGYFAN